jgi:hypothetical protein
MKPWLKFTTLLCGLALYSGVAAAQPVPSSSSDYANVTSTEADAALESDTPREARASRYQRDRDALGWYVPDYAKLQTGGYVGLANARLGYAFLNDIFNLEVGYGFAPSKNEVGASHSLDFALAVRPFELHVEQFRLVPLYATAGLIYIFGDHFEARYSERYTRIDPNYYPPTALHWTLALGTEVGFAPARGFVEKHALYYQLTTMDTFAVSYLENRERVSLLDAVSSTVGYRINF